MLQFQSLKDKERMDKNGQRNQRKRQKNASVSVSKRQKAYGQKCPYAFKPLSLIKPFLFAEI